MALVICYALTYLPQRALVDATLIRWSKGVKGDLFKVLVSATFPRGVCSTFGLILDWVNSFFMF